MSAFACARKKGLGEMRGRFITLEGGEGTGKSTLIEGLAEALRATGRAVMTTREPGGTELAERIRNLALHPPEGQVWSPLAMALLMNAAREDHLRRQIRPALRHGHWVLCDRFSDSTRAYQSVDGVPLSVLKQMEQAVLGETMPDLTLILDAPPDALLGRRAARGVSDAFETASLDFHRGVRQAFLKIVEEDPHRCVQIDALDLPENILSQALAVIRKRFLR